MSRSSFTINYIQFNLIKFIITFSMKSLDDIPYELVAVVEAAIKQKSLLQKLVNTYSYQEQLTFQSNLKILAQYLVNYIHIPPQYVDSLNLFMTDKNLPIEFTLRPLRLFHVINFLKDWLNHFSHKTLYESKAQKISFRNTIFKAVLIEQKSLIDDYFLTISQKNMLISDDIFNLLRELLSHYYLYEHKCDSLAFFDKQNVFESFKRTVNSYLSQNRLQCESKLQDKNYIRRDQLQSFIKFWQDSNQELLLCVDKRLSICESGSQTDSNKTYHIQVQTEHQNDTILHLINSTLTKLNSCSQQEIHSQAIQRIRSFLLAQKISILRKKEKQVGKYRQPPQTQKYKLTATKTFFPQTPKLSNLSLCVTPKKEAQRLQPQINQKQGLGKPLQRKMESSLLISKTLYRLANK